MIRSQLNPKQPDHYCHIAFFTISVGTVLALIYLYFRIGLPAGDTIPVLRSLCLLFFAVISPFAVKNLAQRFSWACTPTEAGSILTALLVMLGLGCFPVIANGAGLLTAGLGLVFAVYFLLKYVTRQPIKATLGLGLFSILFAYWISGIIYAYHSPYFIERLSLGLIRPDTMYMADLATMFDLHGTPSSGLNGVPFAHYHFGANICFALLSRLLNISSLQFYLISYSVFIIPLFFNMFLTCIAEWMSKKTETFFSNKLNIAFFLLLFACGFIGLFPPFIQKSYALDWQSLLRSETYLFSLILLFTFLPITTRLFAGVIKSETPAGKPQKFFAIIVLPVMLAAITVCKISTGFLLCGAFYYLFFRLKLYRQAWAILALLMITLFTYKAYAAIRFYSETPFFPFHFLRTYLKTTWVPLFFIFYYAWLWLCMGITYCKMKMSHFSIKEMWASRETLPLEMVVFIAAMGFIPGNVMAIAGGSGAYFMQPFQWLALAFCLANIPVVTQEFQRAINHKGLSWQKTSALGATVLLLVSVSYNWYWIGYKGVRFVQKSKHLITESKSLKTSELINAMLQIGNQPANFRKHTALYIPRSNRLFWGLFDNCRINPIVAPTLTRMAMINGLPSSDCNLKSENVIAYGYPEYPHSEYFKSDENAAQMCAKAREKGFQQVLLLGAKDSELIKIKLENSRHFRVTGSKGQLYQQLVRCNPANPHPEVQ